MDAGWIEGKDWINEVELSGMPNKSEIGFADYVLYDDMHRPLRNCRSQNELVWMFQKEDNRQSFMRIYWNNNIKEDRLFFLTNGFETQYY